MVHDFGASQFTMLAIDVAMSVYVGTIARSVTTKIGEKRKAEEPLDSHLQAILGSLVLADLLLIIIALALAYRIYVYASDKPLPTGFDQGIAGLIGVTIVYLVILHAIQWVVWLKKIK